MYSKEEQKKAAAWQAAMEVEDNMVLGLGTGSTVYYLWKTVRNDPRRTECPWGSHFS